jgi:hypothetical protein
VHLAEQSSGEENQETSAVISQCQIARKVSPALAFLPIVSFFSPAFRHPGSVQYSSTAVHELVRHCPAMQSSKVLNNSQLLSSKGFH